ncbi:hypothetical protein H2198_003382 [Neophaeococcomyces mojaviensis]|uniref:Uncharacterized protein n=1 Tax=Neophaeococcomyces mojaviensis TaxID=3383035 RepID=A0ACC3ABH2_9EURO|nr:hypothetical protein H2198_003382 [Knufia sp. JES_112]
MAKTKTKSRSNSKDILRSTSTPLVKSTVSPSRSQKSTEVLLAEASDLLESSQPELALPLAQEALRRLEADKKDYENVETLLRLAAQEKPTFPTALILGGDICFALGDVDKARAQYELATTIDPDGQLISAEPWLQLAQLCEEGGSKSIEYFDKAIEIMKNEIDVLDDDEAMALEHTKEIVNTRRQKVAEALCGMAEVYMTDLSWEADAEQQCEQLVTEAIAICPEALSAGVLQTLASIRISQERVEEARKVLAHSLAIWKDVPVDTDDPSRPDFATRVSLVRLLMEVEQEADAMGVLEELVREDDQSVECLYLGGWCHLLLSQKGIAVEDGKPDHAEQARSWLGNCLKLFKTLQYEDEPLRQHAEELVQQLSQSLGDDGWEDTDDDDKDDEEDKGDLEIEAGNVDHNKDKDKDVEMT